MNLSSIHCRAQEALQHDRASSAQLENVRIIAERAAKAWGVEAIAAEQREARNAHAAAIAEAIALQDRQPDDQPEQGFSENPDRGFAQL